MIDFGGSQFYLCGTGLYDWNNNDAAPTSIASCNLDSSECSLFSYPAPPLPICSQIEVDNSGNLFVLFDSVPQQLWVFYVATETWILINSFSNQSYSQEANLAVWNGMLDMWHSNYRRKHCCWWKSAST